MDGILDVDLILRNGVVHTPAGGDAVAIAGGLVVAVGTDSEVMRLADAGTQVIDCQRRAVVPGIVDAHCHLFAAAATFNSADCRPTTAPDIATVVSVLREAAPRPDGWIRGYGYDDSPLGLGRHLTRRDLDAVATDRPVRVEQRSGHACVLNSAGLAAVGIGRDTPDPPGGVIVRDDAGVPTGLLLELNGWLRERISPSPGADTAALRRFAQGLLEYGITAVTDAGPENGIQRWQTFTDIVAAGVLPQRVTMMAGYPHIEEIRDAGLRYGDTVCNGMLTVGHAKIMLTASSGRLHPHPEQLSEMVAMAHGMSYPVAVHAVEQDAVVAAALALTDHPTPVGQDRIEHCGECPPGVAELVAQSGTLVVPNTGFLHYDGERYLRTVSDKLLAHLYPAGALHALGVPVALASDAPVVEPNPWAAMAAAVTRRTAAGAPIGGIGFPSVAGALDKHTGGNRIAPGYPADLAVVEPDPFTTLMADLPAVRAVATVVAGRVALRSGI